METRSQNDSGLNPYRKDFPILSRKLPNGKPLIYLDNAATTQKPRQVIEALTRYYTEYNANVHRGIHQLSEEATAAYDGAHEEVARFLGARSWEEIVFTKNATEALNMAALSLARSHLKKGDEVILSEMEHHSNLVPWQQLARQYGFTVKYIPVTEEGELDLAAYERMLSPRTKVVSVTQMSNVLGTINPVREMAAMAHEHGALFVVDGAQSVPHFAVDVKRLDCDLLALSGHKMLGPTGIGALYGKREILDAMEPFLYGGDMIREVSFTDSKWNDLPWKFEAGTPSIADGIALAEAVRYLSKAGMDEVARHERILMRHGFDTLGALPGVRIYGPGQGKERGGLLSFWAEPVHPHDLASVLNEDGIAIRAGHHCTMPLIMKLGVPALARASFYLYNTKEEIDDLASAVARCQKMFR